MVGSPFYIMRYVDGEVIRTKLPQQYVDSPQTQPAIGESLIDALVELLHAGENFVEAVGRQDTKVG